MSPSIRADPGARTLNVDCAKMRVRSVITTIDPDRAGDVIVPAGLKNLDGFMTNPVVLWAHDRVRVPPIGACAWLDVQPRRIVAETRFAQGVPFAREYGGLLDNRSFGGAQVSRTFYARGQTGQQLELGAYQALMRQVELGTVELHTRHEMLDLVVKDGRAVGIIVRDLVTGAITSHSAHAVILASGGYGNVFYLSTNAVNSNVTAAWRAHKRGAFFANPCFTQIHPTCIPVSGTHQSKLTLMSESLRNDGRVWVPMQAGDNRSPDQIPDAERDYYLERVYPSFGNLAPRDVASRQAKYRCDEGRGVGASKLAVYLDFRDAIKRDGEQKVREKYGNLFQMYERITGEDPYKQPMRIYPAVHYTMGGLWVDYNLMSNVPGLYVLGEANFSDHGANRLGASALMQGLSDGYFVLPYTIGNELAPMLNKAVPGTDHPEFKKAEEEARNRYNGYLAVNGTTSLGIVSKARIPIASVRGITSTACATACRATSSRVASMPRSFRTRPESLRSRGICISTQCGLEAWGWARPTCSRPGSPDAKIPGRSWWPGA